MNSWTRNLESLRRRELARAFAGCPEKAFLKTLELGAGSGFQSRQLLRYTHELVSTDLDTDRLKRVPVPGITYVMCDAELVDHCFGERSFDLVFASNLFEHLPDPERALRGIGAVLKPGGIVILVMPNALWKTFSLLGFYPNAARLAFRALRKGRLAQLLKRYLSREQPPLREIGNNRKSAPPDARAGILWPTPHGAYPDHRTEFWMYRKKRWIALFTACGFTPIAVRFGPVSSGYGFGFARLGRLLELVGLTTEYIYVLKISGQQSPHERYWQERAV